MDGMEDFPYEFTKPLLLCFNLLKRCNIGFFDDNVPFLQKYWRFLFLVLLILIQHIALSISLSRLFTSQMKISDLAFMVPIYLIVTQGFLKAAVILPKKADIADLIKQLGMMWRIENLSEIQTQKKNKLLKRLNFGHAAFYWGSMIAAWQNVMAPLVYTLFGKFVLKQDTELLLAIESAYPFDPVKNWIRYIAMYIFQVYTYIRVVYYYIGTEFLMITLCAHLSTEFAILREDLKHIKPKKNKVTAGSITTDTDDRSGNTMENFIRNHQKLIELTRSLNNIFNLMVFINLLFASIIICFFGFGITVAHGAVDIANNFILVLALLLPIYILCYYAELLKNESTGIADSAYENLWYEGGTHYQKSIQFIIKRSQRPCCLTSLNYIPITLNTFTKVEYALYIFNVECIRLGEKSVYIQPCGLTIEPKMAIQVVSTTWSYFSLARTMYSDN